MKIKKIFVLFTMLLAGLSFKGTNNVEKNVVADAAEVGSYAYFSSSWDSSIIRGLSNQGVSSSDLFKTILITNDESKVTARGDSLGGCPVEVGIVQSNSYGSDYTKPEYYTNGCAVAAYVYPNATDSTMFDCIFYANVETIYVNYGRHAFSLLANVEKITFDCKFSMARTSDKCMARMFYNSKKLAQIEGLENFDTTNVTDMSNMFDSCTSLMELDVSSFDTSKVTAFSNMFRGCKVLTNIKGLEKWNTSSVTDTTYMFYNCRMLETINVSSFDTSKITTMSNMFAWCENATTIEGLEKWNTSNVIDMSGLFYCCSKLMALDVSHFKTTNVTNMDQMFFNCSSLTELDVSCLDTSNVTIMSRMFCGCDGLTTLDVSNFVTSNVTTMFGMFSSSVNLTTIKGLENFNTSKVTDMSAMFNACLKLTEVDLSSFDTSNVTTMRSMFGTCYALATIKGLKNFNTSKVTDMSVMFNDCSSLTTLDLSNFDFTSITNDESIEYIVLNTKKLEEIKLPKNLNGYTIQLLNGFDMNEVDPSMEGWTVLRGSKEFNVLYNNLMNLKTCDDYMQSPELQTMYDGLTNEEKDKLATLTDNDGVILTEKLAYMVYLAEAHTVPATAETHMVISPIAGQYLVIVIACLSLSLIGGYYFIQKKKYAK